MEEIHILVGPPTGGKSTYLEKYRAQSDVVVDQDALNTAMGGKHRHSTRTQREVAFAARAAAISKIVTDRIDARAWIIHSNPSPAQVEYYGKAGAVFHVIAPPIEDVLARSGEDDRPAEMKDIIRAWYENPPKIPAAWLASEPKQSASPDARKTMKIKHAQATLKAPTGSPSDSDDVAGLKEGQFIAYASTFTREPDASGDVVAKGAFADTLKEWAESGNTLPVLFGHRMDDPDYYIGGVLEAKEDDHGLRILGQLDLDSPKGAQVYRLIKGRRLSQLSFAFDVIDSSTVTLEDGSKANELRKLKIYEVSLVPIGANQTTEVVAVKEAAQIVAESVKAGRTLSAKNEETLREAISTLASVSSSIKNVLAANDSGEAEAKTASGNPPAPVKAPSVSPSAKSLSQLIDITLALNACK
ncbi:HK97 family phage prohead protease [Arcanobacterium canis]